MAPPPSRTETNHWENAKIGVGIHRSLFRLSTGWFCGQHVPYRWLRSAFIFFFTGCPSVCGHTLTSLHVFLWADKRNWWTLVAMLFSMIVVFCLVSPGTSESNCSCGIKRADRIVGGFDVSPDQWPWQVSLVNVAAGAIHWCGGALIASRWILTAAHCLHHQTADKLIVRLGSGVVHFVCIFHTASLTFLFRLK